MDQEKKSNGALIGSIIVILLLVVGAVYFWMTGEKPAKMTEEQKAVVESYEDLNIIDQELGLELGSIDAELGQNLDAGTLE